LINPLINYHEEVMEIFRIVLATDSRLLRGMLRRVIEKKSNLELVGETSELSTAVEIASTKDADWVIVSLSPDEHIPPLADELLFEEPGIAIMAISDNGQAFRVKWFEIHETAYRDWALDEMLAMLQGRPSEAVVGSAS
jgi:chemotaxis response regulator CheB